MWLLREAQGRAPNSPLLAYHFGVALLKVGDLDGARRVLSEVVEKHASSSQYAQAEALLKRLE